MQCTITLRAQISDYFRELKIKYNETSALCCDAKIPRSLGSEGLFCFEATRLCVYIRPIKPDYHASSQMSVLFGRNQGIAACPDPTLRPGVDREPDMVSALVRRDAGLDGNRVAD